MKNIIVFACVFFCCLFSNQVSGQKNKIDITVHSRVNTLNKDVKEIVELWTNYLNSQPDSIYDNPYWNNAEKLRFKNFDFSRAYLYQFRSDELLGYFKPTILSVEKEGEIYSIRTIFSADGLEGEYRKSNPWCITKLYAVKEQGIWKLQNALPVITEKWNRKTMGGITFIYPPQHLFDEELAKKANSFCNQVTEEFQFPVWEPFEFYITESGEELGRLLNFDFFFAGYTTGIGMNDNRILFSSLGSAFYPTEFIHLIVPTFNRHGMMEEGFATWKGGTLEKNFDEAANILAEQVRLNESVTFTDILDKKWGWPYAAFYITGAVFCKAAYDKGGPALVKTLLETPNDNEKLTEAICSVFDIKKEELNTFWRKEIIKYKK